MLLNVILSYLRLLLPPALFLWGVGMIIYAIVGTAVTIGRSFPVFALVVFVLVCIFLLA